MNLPLVDLRAQYETIRADVDAAVAEVVAESAFVGTANNRFVRRFEGEFAGFVGTKFCVACGNGTDALEIILAAAGIGPGDEVLVPALSWIATSEAVTNAGATPVFVDILSDTYSMDPALARAKVTSRTKAIIPVHLYGGPARMDDIRALADRHGLFLLEDCAQAHGATFRGRRVGTMGHAAAFSFFPGKNLGAWGDAGAMLTDDESLASTARMISQHGQTGRKHEHLREGRNSRMDGIQAAVLRVKLERLPEWTAARQRLAGIYQAALRDVVCRMQGCDEGSESAYHLFVVEVENRDRVQSLLAAEGIATAVQYPRPLPLLPAYQRLGHSREDFPVASRVSSRVLSIPLFPELTPPQQQRVIGALAAAVEASRAQILQ